MISSLVFFLRSIRKLWTKLREYLPNAADYTRLITDDLSTTCRNYLLIVKAWKQRTKIRMGRLPFSHVRMNYFWWAKTERIVVYSAVNLLFRNNKIQLSKCHYITIFMNCKISLTYISETHWKQSIKFQIESMFHFPFS